jgi:hypothetical protein
MIVLEGVRLVSGTNWNPAAASSVQWATQRAYDTSVFTHSTSTNSHQITVDEAGSYFVSYNDAINGAVGRGNTTVKVLVNGTEVTGAQVKSHYIRNQSGHTNSSGS